jgi:hypothetical protein
MNALSSFRCTLAALCIATCTLIGCGTPTQPTGASDPSGIAYVGNVQSAGFVHDANGREIWLYDENHALIGGEVYPGYVDKYVALWAKVGVKEMAPKYPFTPHGDLFLVTAEGAQAFESMNRAAK